MKSYVIILVAVLFLSCFGLPNFAACPSADLTGDCRVDFADFAKMAQQWLSEGIPESVPPILTGTPVSPNSGFVPCNQIYNMRRDNTILTKNYTDPFTQSPICGDTLTQSTTGATLYVTQGNNPGGYILYGNTNGIEFNTTDPVTSDNASGVTMNPSSFVPNYFRTVTEAFYGVPQYNDGTVTTRTLLQDGHNGRIFMDGTVVGAKIKMYSVDAATTTIRVAVYRYDAGTSTWTRKWISESWPITTSGSEVTVMCSEGQEFSDISTGDHARVGDFIAVEITGKREAPWTGTLVSVNVNMNGGDNGDYGNDWTLRVCEGEAPASGTVNTFVTASSIPSSHDLVAANDFADAYKSTGACVHVQLLMAKPLWVGIGDSYIAGSTACTSFFASMLVGGAIDPVPADFRNWDPSANILGYLSARLPATTCQYANLAQGGTRTVEWDSTEFGGGGFLDDAIALNPKYALISFGANDASSKNPSGQALSYADFIVRYNRILQTLKANGITPVVILPLGVLGVDAPSPPAWNADIKAYCVANNIRYIDGYTVMKNSTDKTYLDHPTIVGYQDIAANIYGNLMYMQAEGSPGN